MRSEFDLSVMQREVLIEHLDGVPRRYRLSGQVRGQERRNFWIKARIAKRFVKIGLLRTIDRYETVITDKGRGVLSDMLADYADVLQRAGYGLESGIRPRRITPAGLSDFRAALHNPANDA